MTPILSAPIHRNRALVTLSALVAVLTAPLLPVAIAAAGEADPGLHVEATNDADGDGVFTDVEQVGGAGQAVIFQVTVTNSSVLPVTITSLTTTMLETTLDLLDAASCGDFDGLTLAPSQTTTCTFTLGAYLRTYGPEPREQLTNMVRVTGTDGQREIGDEDDSTVVNPNAGRVSVEVDKANDADGDGAFTDDETAPAAGADVAFEVVVRNTSPGSVVVTELVDTWPGLDEPIDLLSSCPELHGKKLWGLGGHGDDSDDGGHDDGHERPTSATCTFTLPGYAPPAGESLTDTVTVTVAKRHDPARSAVASDTSSVTTPPEQVAANPAIGLEKRIGLAASGPFADHDAAPGMSVSIPTDGAAVYYELEVVNAGDTDLTQISLRDQQLDLSSCAVPTTLVPAATFSCVLGPVAAVAGDQSNEATVTATGAGQTVEATDAAHYHGTALGAPGITLTVSADITPDADGTKHVRFDPHDDDEETVTYVFSVENTGTTVLSDVMLTDDRLGPIAWDSTTLEAGETVRILSTHVVDGDDAETGAIRNTAIVRGVAPDGTAVTAEATEQVMVLAVRAEAVRAAPSVLPQAGGSVVGLALVAVVALSGGLAVALVDRGRRRRHG